MNKALSAMIKLERARDEIRYLDFDMSDETFKVAIDLFDAQIAELRAVVLAPEPEPDYDNSDEGIRRRIKTAYPHWSDDQVAELGRYNRDDWVNLDPALLKLDVIQTRSQGTTEGRAAVEVIWYLHDVLEALGDEEVNSPERTLVRDLIRDFETGVHIDAYQRAYG